MAIDRLFQCWSVARGNARKRFALDSMRARRSSAFSGCFMLYALPAVMLNDVTDTACDAAILMLSSVIAPPPPVAVMSP